MSRPPTRERLDLLLRPLPGAHPAGPPLDLRDEAFRKLQAELDRCNSLTHGTVWSNVQAGADALLAARTKDLRIAVALARAWWEAKEGAASLALGLELVAGLVRGLWDPLHPRALDERVDALDLLIVWIDERWSRVELPPATAGPLVDALTDLCAAIRERLAERAPDLDPLERLAEALRECLSGPVDKDMAQTASATSDAAAARTDARGEPSARDATLARPATDAAANDARSAGDPGATRPAAAAGTTTAARPDLQAAELPDLPVSSAELGAFLRALRGRLVELAALLRREDPSSARATRLLRQAAWLSFDGVEADARGVVPFPPPPPALRAAIDLNVRQQQWAALLQRCEDNLAAHPLWLDLQHHAAAAMTQLGPAHAAARRELEHELRGLLARAPKLPELTFRDGTPLAGPEARGFLAGLTGLAGAADPAPSRPTDPAGLHAAASRAPSGRERFLLRRELARSCLAAGRPDVAAGLLAGMRDEARRHGLGTWEPDLLVTCLSELLGAARTLGNEARTRLGVDHALAELSDLNPAVALTLGRELLQPRA